MVTDPTIVAETDSMQYQRAHSRDNFSNSSDQAWSSKFGRKRQCDAILSGE